MKGLFVNQVKNNCSIFESGLMIYKALVSSNNLDIDYLSMPISEMSRYAYVGYDYYIFNWHHNTLPIPKSTIDGIKGLKIGILLEVGIADMRPFMVEDLFDAYMVIDPTKQKAGKYYPFPRPLEQVDKLLPLLSNEVPVIGTFGFLVPGKNFGEVLQQANNLKLDCILRMNFPDAAFTGQPPHLSRSYAERLKNFRSKNVDLRITFDYMSKLDLIQWCSQHTINVFPYYRDMPGLSATTDQAIVAGRAIAVTNCNTFRHMHKYISHFPEQSYMELAESTLPGISRMKEDWSNDRFVDMFNLLLSENIGR